jgi:hypothetical protein
MQQGDSRFSPVSQIMGLAQASTEIQILQSYTLMEGKILCTPHNWG